MSHNSNRFLAIIVILLSLFGCSRTDAYRIARAAASGNPVAAAESLARDKAIGYTLSPETLTNDIKKFHAAFESFLQSVKGAWGNNNTQIPTPKKYVKYTNNYLSRATVDFDTGHITIETLDQSHPEQSLKSAIVTTLLTPSDPRSVDLYSAKAIKLGDTPFLFGEVRDQDNKDIRWAWRAERYAEYLMKTALTLKTNNDKIIRSVTFSMLKDHLDIRARKYKELVQNAASRFHVSRNLIYAIMKVESDFNPFAISSAMAIGLMQVVPSTAGSDVYQYLHEKEGAPSRETLYSPPNNITYGTAYLHLLGTRYLKGINSPISREYCIIAGYNGGAGSVLKTFSSNKSKAPRVINALSPAKVYETLRNQLPHEETRRYLGKVLEAKKHFVNF